MFSRFYLIFTCFLTLLLFHLKFYEYKIVLSIVYNALSNADALNISFSGSPVLRWQDVSFTPTGDSHRSWIFFPCVDISSKILTIRSLELPYDSEDIHLDASVKKNLNLRHLTSDFHFIVNYSTPPKVASAWLDGDQVVVVAAMEHLNHSAEHTPFRLWLLSRHLNTLWSKSFSVPIATASKPAFSLQVVDCFHKRVLSCSTVLFIFENDTPSHSEVADPFVFAVSLKAGSLLWQHFPTSSPKNQKSLLQTPKEIMSAFNTALNVSSPLSRHWKVQALASDVDRVFSKKWRKYRDLLLAALPIRWHGDSDTRALMVDGQSRILFILQSPGISFLNGSSGEFIASLSPHLTFMKSGDGVRRIGLRDVLVSLRWPRQF
ncbi:unnamed protein product [Dibothriocephalus latus]|uniref:Uncharacterized protein n=1 Tax=Dibothriocephalus latus TaxID=60516 RepID=A0A3P7NJH7_DIBLA|nr:unnamed protein product [Dibothriocephalus latus]